MLKITYIAQPCNKLRHYEHCRILELKILGQRNF